jgi:hypothetical protein
VIPSRRRGLRASASIPEIPRRAALWHSCRVSPPRSFFSLRSGFVPGRTRANNVTIGLTGDPVGSLWIENDSTGPVDVVLDVSGYFK